jgi:hypothetical protein
MYRQHYKSNNLHIAKNLKLVKYFSGKYFVNCFANQKECTMFIALLENIFTNNSNT